MKKSIFIILILAFVASWATPATAFTLPQFLRVGLYFGSNARTNMMITSTDGLWMGHYVETEFTPIWQTGNVIIRKDTHFTTSSTGINGIA